MSGDAGRGAGERGGALGRTLLMVAVGVLVPLLFGVLVVWPILDGEEAVTIPASTTVARLAHAVPTPSAAPPSSAASSDPAASTVPSLPVTTVPAAGTGASPGTLPDGTPEPVVAVFDGATITLSGAVPSRDAAERLTALALANSTTAATVMDRLTIDPAVPAGVGVRVIEMSSARFPEASTDILREHAAELDRVVRVMNALPNVTALVIGHADQRGAEDLNYQLSEGRAQAVVRYLVAAGIAPSRLASRAVGETDLLTLGDDETALALNRRTEFVFYGLLVEG